MVYSRSILRPPCTSKPLDQSDRLRLDHQIDTRPFLFFKGFYNDGYPILWKQCSARCPFLPHRVHIGALLLFSKLCFPRLAVWTAKLTSVDLSFSMWLVSFDSSSWVTALYASSKVRRADREACLALPIHTVTHPNPWKIDATCLPLVFSRPRPLF